MVLAMTQSGIGQFLKLKTGNELNAFLIMCKVDKTYASCIKFHGREALVGG